MQNSKQAFTAGAISAFNLFPQKTGGICNEK